MIIAQMYKWNKTSNCTVKTGDFMGYKLYFSEAVKKLLRNIKEDLI